MYKDITSSKNSNIFLLLPSFIHMCSLSVKKKLHVRVFYIFSITGLCIISLVYICLLWYVCVAKYSGRVVIRVLSGLL